MTLTSFVNISWNLVIIKRINCRKFLFLTLRSFVIRSSLACFILYFRMRSSCSSWVNLTALVLTFFSSSFMVLCNPHGPIHHRIIHNDDQPTFFPAETIPHVPDLRPMTRGINPTSHRGPHQGRRSFSV